MEKKVPPPAGKRKPQREPEPKIDWLPMVSGIVMTVTVIIGIITGISYLPRLWAALVR